jgi:hypothetical protein
MRGAMGNLYPGMPVCVYKESRPFNFLLVDDDDDDDDVIP